MSSDLELAAVDDAQSGPASPQLAFNDGLIASRGHLIAFIVFLAATAVMSYISVNVLGGGALSPVRHAVRRYLFGIAAEGTFVLFVWYGIRKRGVTLSELVGGRWTGPIDVLKDFAIAFGSWFAFTFALGLVAIALHQMGFQQKSMPERVMDLLPKTKPELYLWFAVSASAGISEEIAFRGYLQRQFAALTGSVPHAVVAQGLFFGVVHIYQGVVQVVIISIIGLLMGALAARRKEPARHDSLARLDGRRRRPRWISAIYLQMTRPHG